MTHSNRKVVIGLAALALIGGVIACDLPSSTITETVTEAELNEELAADNVTVDFRPGEAVFSTEVEGQTVEMYVSFAAVDGQLEATLTRVTLDGTEMGLDMFEGASDSFSAALSDEIDYYVDSVEITDTEMVVTGHEEE